MSNDSLIQKCIDTICENLEPEQVFDVCVELLEDKFDTFVLSVEDPSDKAGLAFLSRHHGDLEGRLVISGICFKQATDDIRNRIK